VVIEILAIVLAAVLALFTLGAAGVASLVVIGSLGIARGRHCHRLRLSGGEGTVEACALCRHERLLHPIDAIHLPVRAGTGRG
jgi:hypothetical protein